MSVCTWACVYMKAMGWHGVYSSNSLHLTFRDGVSHILIISHHFTGLADQWVLGIPLSLPSMHQVINVCDHTQLLHGCQESKLGFSCCCWNQLTDWAISPAPINEYFLKISMLAFHMILYLFKLPFSFTSWNVLIIFKNFLDFILHFIPSSPRYLLPTRYIPPNG